MSRSGLARALALVAILLTTCARAQEHEQPETRSPVGGVVSPEGAMIFYAAHGRDEACGVNCSDWIAAERGYIDDVIMPHATRSRIARALAMLRGKTVEMPPRKHDNLPV